MKTRLKKILQRKKVIKVIGCGDCKSQWKTRCPLCKQEAKHWVLENGKNFLKDRVEANSRPILKRNGIYEAFIGLYKYIDPRGSERNKSVSYDAPERITQEGPPIQPCPITMDNFYLNTTGTFTEVRKVLDGFELFFESKESKYYIDSSKALLLRESNHWGSGIRFCNWYLKGRPKIPCWKWVKRYSSDVLYGVIAFNQFKPNKIS